MSAKKLTSFLLAIVVFALPLSVSASTAKIDVELEPLQNRRITCESFSGGYNYCRVDTNNSVRLINRTSFSSCTYGSDWGYDKRGIWVDHGCRAEFEYGKSSAGGAIAGGAILGGLILAAAIASKKKKEKEETHPGWETGQDYVPNYYVGTFKGYNDRDNTFVEITINPSGSISIKKANGSYDSGYFRDEKVNLPWGEYSVERDEGGFMARRNGSSVFFARVR